MGRHRKAVGFYSCDDKRHALFTHSASSILTLSTCTALVFFFFAHLHGRSVAFWNPMLTPHVRMHPPPRPLAPAREVLFSSLFPTAEAPTAALTLFSDGGVLSSQWET